MVGSFYKRGDFAWVQDVRANYVCIHNGELLATVLSTEWLARQVYPKDAVLLECERFADLFAAMSRGEEIVSGTSEGAFLVALRPFWEPAR